MLASVAPKISSNGYVPSRVAARLLERIEALLDRPFGASCNPLRHLGALGFFLFWLILGSGIYLYFAFDATASGAYRSIDELSHTPLGALARGLHRYASDAFVAVIALHLVKEYVKGRFTGARWFPWLTGVALIWFVYASGIGGYWLVWDEVAQFSLTATAEWLDYLPLFGPALVRNFLQSSQMTDRFYSLLMFLHIGVPLFLLAGMWLHIQRVARSDVHPARALAVGTFATLAVLSFAHPALSQAPADPASFASDLPLDWWLLFIHPIMERTSPGMLWSLAAAATILLGAAPWLARAPRAAPAEVSLDNCNGCGRCFVDCPYDAVVMMPRTDGRHMRMEREARVNPELCVACGICAGACPSSTPFRNVAALVTGIDIPQRPLAAMRADLEARLAAMSGETRVVVFACERALERLPARRDTGVVPLLCAAQLPPSFVEYALRSGADGVLVAGCARDGCHFRLGDRWTEQRLAARREPRLRDSVQRERVRAVWTHDVREFAGALEQFRGALRALPARRGLPPRRLAASAPAHEKKDMVT